MKLRALATILVAASIAASAATAGNPPPTGKDRERGAKRGERQGSAEGCRLLLRGLYVSGSVGDGGTGSFVVDVKRTDRLGKRLKLAGSRVTVGVDARTKVRRGGEAELADLQPNDHVAVMARACKVAGDEAPTLLARVVAARPAAPPNVPAGA